MCEKYLDDRVIIPESIKKMTKDELDKEIERIESEHKKKKTYNMNV